MKVPAFFVGYGIVKFALEEYAGSEYLSLQANGQCILATCEDEIGDKNAIIKVAVI